MISAPEGLRLRDRPACASSWILLRCAAPHPLAHENLMAKPNYQQARKQRELARKSRQQEKQQRRSTRSGVADPGPQAEPVEGAVAGTPGARVAGGG